MNHLITSSEVQAYINDYDVHLVSDLAFKESPFEGVSIGELIDQIKGRETCRKKLKLLYETQGIYYPPKRALEQSSSQQTAAYKSSLVSGDSFIDITGGMGVDSYFFSLNFKNGVHCELHPDLSEITKFNAGQMNANNISFHIGDGISFCQNLKKPVDLIYIDPSRRKTDNSRMFFLAETEPNVLEHLKLLLQSSHQLLIKTSPLLDIKKGIKQLKGVAEVHTVSLNNEVKELLWLWKKERNTNPPILKAVDLSFETTQIFEFSLNEEKAGTIEYGEIKKYLYEPSKAILKSGGFKTFARQINLTKINEHSHLYTSDKLITIQGRSFEVKKVNNYNKKELKKRFGKMKRHILKKNYPESVANIRKKTGILEGGQEFLIFTTNFRDERIVVEASPLFHV